MDREDERPASSCATGWEKKVAEGSATSELRGLGRETALAGSDARRRRTAGWAGPTLSLAIRSLVAAAQRD
jgi:hypothetical protein